MVSLSPFFQTAVIGWGEAGKQNHWEKARPVKGLTRGNGAGAVNPGSLCMDPAERAKLRLFCSLPAVLGSRWTSCLAGWKRGETMRKLAAFTVSFALGICLAQYLLPERLLLPVAAVFFAAA